jgi:hypothetical protein
MLASGHSDGEQNIAILILYMFYVPKFVDVDIGTVGRLLGVAEPRLAFAP